MSGQGKKTRKQGADRERRIETEKYTFIYTYQEIETLRKKY